MDDGEAGKLQEQLFHAGMFEFYGGLAVLARTLEAHNGSHAKTLMLYHAALAQVVASSKRSGTA